MSLNAYPKPGGPRSWRQLTNPVAHLERTNTRQAILSLVKKDVVLSKAVSIMKRSQRSKGQSSSSSKEDGHDFSRGPPAMHGGRQGRNSYLYPPQSLQWRKYNRGGAVGHSFTPGVRRATTETTTGRSESTSTEVLKIHCQRAT